ncbi:ChaN family lipoprotein [Halomonas beimenensis]|uniref:PDZ domain-containing protein n=1 Tax=Halomonas beimenensis TaxID=475662 RepID=A0A291P605_9GAMM|nr:ChaN family lipoprotein [Halomonas beimenensis]ATJ82333.1 hypothetical protein BEI_1346 [Halomonas beimenensis]
MSRRRFPPLSALALLAGLALPALAHGQDCPAPGQWLAGDGTPVTTDALMRAMADQEVVLLGEQHDRADHHRWQLHTLAGLHALRPDLVIGLEMLPRESQPALDAWVAGELTEAEFLEASGWYAHWRLDPDLYLPILHFARLHGIPLKALNVSGELRRRLAQEGWEAIPAAERYGITPPAAPAEGYRRDLETAFAEHDLTDETVLERFIDAQLVWDRAMATALAEAAEGDALVVGLMGWRHLTNGHGVPHQLADLGVTDQRALLPRSPGDACEPPPDGLADAFFVLAEPPGGEPPAPPRLGVLIDAGEDGVTVQAVEAGSVAEATGLREGDIILSAAGRPLASPGELSALIHDLLPGTLLPLEVRRGDATREMLARFPSVTR